MARRPSIFTKIQEVHLLCSIFISFNPQQPYQVSIIVIPSIQMKKVRLRVRFLNPGTGDILDQIVLCYGGDVLCIVRCLATSLVSICQMPVVYPIPRCDNQKCLHALPNVLWEPKHPHFSTTGLEKSRSLLKVIHFENSRAGIRSLAC